MNNEINYYFPILVEEVRVLMEKLLIANSNSFFIKRARSLIVANPESRDSGNDLILYPVNFDLQIPNDSQWIQMRTEKQSMISFRAPCKLNILFALCTDGDEFLQKIQDIEKLGQFFFENKTLPAIVPDYLKKYSEIHKIFNSARAEIRMTEHYKTKDWVRGCFFSFEYSTLFHTGEPTREEKLVQKRNLQMVHKKNEEEGAEK